ncbi:MAG: MMPL family transporter, partial [Candidatus Dormibacteraeota bacterium]|nr:MMPL family transporter [Candidatus Dormibacteraeota bacterium]
MERGWAVAGRWGAFVARRRYLVLGVWLVAVVALGLLATTTAQHLSPSGFQTDTPASATADTVARVFPERTSPVVMVVLSSSSTPFVDPAYRRQIAAWQHSLENLVRQQHAGMTVQPVPGKDGRTFGLFLMTNRNATNYLGLANQVQAIHHPGPAQVYIGGLATTYNSFIQDSEQGVARSEEYSLPIALVLLLLVFGGVVAGLLPVITGFCTVSVAIGVVGLIARSQEVSIFALNVSTILGLGLGIDYSLLVVNRFREELRAGTERSEAVATTVATAGVATLISGSTVAIGFGALMLSRLNVVWSIGLGGVIVVAISVVSSLTLIPALLAIFGGAVDRLALPFVRGRDTRPFWHGLASLVMGRPAVWIAAVLAVIALLVFPARNLLLGVEGVESLPPSADPVTAQRLAQEHLGVPVRAPTLVVVHGVHTLGESEYMQARIQAVSGGQPVTGPASVPPQEWNLYLRDGYAIYTLTQPAGDNSPRTHEWLNRLRTAQTPPGVTLQVTGVAAIYQDYLAALTSDFPKILVTVLAGTLILLGLAFRSVLLPIKAVLMNLLSVGAAMGVLTWGFQEGHFASVLDFQT